MSTLDFKIRLPRARGLSILEVALAVLLLSVCSLALLSASVSSGTANRQSMEYNAAVAAARKKMEEICSTPFAKIVQYYGVGSPAPTMGNTFPVYMNEGTEINNGGTVARGVVLPGFRKVVNGVDNYDAGQIVIVNNESAAPSTYGYSCSRSPTDPSPDYGQPGGISFQAIPIDLTGNGTTTDGNCYNLLSSPPVTTAVRLPVGVIIRWDGLHGPERYELWTIVTIY